MTLTQKTTFFVAAVSSIALCAATADAQKRSTREQATVAKPAEPAIKDPVTRFTLANGLKVIVQTNKRVPLITAALSYDVGSKDEKPGQYGYAHLFEHLMIGGSAHWNQDSLRSLRDMGATNTNATTTQDTTLFYETFPSAALERVLFLEADRMGHIGDALTPERVKTEVGVVLSELRMRRDDAYGGDDRTMLADLYPADHPYHHDVGGLQADLDVVTVDAARKWFDQYYGPSNVTLVLTGDIEPGQARTLVEKYFGALEPRLPVDRLLTRSPVLAGPIRREVFGAVPLGRIYATHLAPPAGSPEIADLDLIAQIMANGTRSRLNRRLVEELGIAQSAEVTFDEGKLSSRMGFVLVGIAPDKIEQAEAEIDAVLAKFVAEGPSQEEVDRARDARVGFLLGTQNSTFGKALLLTRNESGAEYVGAYLSRLRAATPESLRRTAQAVYGRPGYRLISRPIPTLKATPGGYDLAKGPPPMGQLAPIAFPAVEQAQLSNGLKVVRVPAADASHIDVLIRFDSGSAGSSRFVSQMALDLMAGKASTPDQRQRGEQLERLGGWAANQVEPDHSDLRLSFDADKLASGVALLGDALTRPGITPAAVEALRNVTVANLGGEGTDGRAMGNRAMLNAVYGQGHPYALGATAQDDIKLVQGIDAAAVNDWTRGHLRPDQATLYIASGIDMARLRPLLDKALAGWTNQGPAAANPPIPPAAGVTTPTLTVVDRPGEAQTYLLASRVLPDAPQSGETEELATFIANQVYGGGPTGRISNNLRADKGWSYGTDSSIYDTRGQRRWLIASLVSADHTGDAITELSKETRALNGEKPPQQAEVDRIVTGSASRAAAQLETNDYLLSMVANSVSDGHPYDYGAKKPERLRALTLDQVRRAAAGLSDPNQLHWIIVGDWQKIQGQLKGLNLGQPVMVRGK